jgi:hypothetical protein
MLWRAGLRTEILQLPPPTGDLNRYRRFARKNHRLGCVTHRVVFEDRRFEPGCLARYLAAS